MKLPGIYVEIRGDYSHLQKEIKAAKALVTEQATGISNALNNALSPQQVKGSIDKLVANFGTLNRASNAAGDAFGKLGVDLGELRKVTGLTETQLAKLQSQLLKTTTANAQERALKSLASACNLTEKEIRELGSQFGLTLAQIGKITGSTKQAESSFLSMGRVAKTAIAYLSVTSLIQSASAIVAIADKYTMLESKIRLVSKEGDNLQATQAALYESANRVKGAYDAQADMYVRTARSMSEYNITQAQTIAYAEAITRSMVISGSTIQEAASFAIQFSQAMQKGNLNDDEFKAVMESNGRAIKVLTDYLTFIGNGAKVTAGDLRQLSTDGKITADVLYNAFSHSYGQLEKEANSMTVTIGQSVVKLKNVFESLVDGANDSSGASKSLTKSIDDLAKTIETNKPGIISLFDGIVTAAGFAVERVANMANSVKGMAAVAAGVLKLSDFATMNPSELKKWMGDYESGIAPVSAKLDEAYAKLKKLREADFEDEGAIKGAMNEVKTYEKWLEGLKAKKQEVAATSVMPADPMGKVNHIVTGADLKKQNEDREKAYKEAFSLIGGKSKEVYDTLKKQYEADKDEFIKVTGDKVTAQAVFDAKMKKLNESATGARNANFNDSNIKYLEYQKAFEEKMASMARITADREEELNRQMYEAGNKNLAQYLEDQHMIRQKAIDANILAKENELAAAKSALSGLSAETNSKGESKHESDASNQWAIMKKIEVAEMRLNEARSKGVEDEEKFTRERDMALVDYQTNVTQAAIVVAELNGEWSKSILLQQDLNTLEEQRGVLDGDRSKIDLIKRQNEELEKMKTPLGAMAKGFTDTAAAWKNSAQQMIDVSRETADAMQSGFSDLFFDTMQGKLKSLGDYVTAFMASVQRSIANMMSQQVASGITGMMGSILGGFATGSSTPGAYTMGNGQKAFAKGDVFNSPGLSAYSNKIVSKPTLFPFAKGVGLMGEAGAEAIMPLTRTSNGVLGVKATGGGSNVIVNVIEAPGKGGQQQQRNENGVSMIDVFVEQIKSAVAGDILSGSGAIPTSMQAAYGLNRAAGSY